MHAYMRVMEKKGKHFLHDDDLMMIKMTLMKRMGFLRYCHLFHFIHVSSIKYSCRYKIGKLLHLVIFCKSFQFSNCN